MQGTKNGAEFSVNVFGYGSLVNRRTHNYAQTRPAQMHGWRRAWRKTRLREVAYLTIIPDQHSEIDGLIATVPPHDWQALDDREMAYDRTFVQHQVSPDPGDVTVTYAIAQGQHQPPDADSPVLLSYIDVVVQGYKDSFGEEGAYRFFDTTDGWDVPILNDRRAPIYSRSQSLTPHESKLVDALLKQVGARVTTA